MTHVLDKLFKFCLVIEYGFLDGLVLLFICIQIIS